MVCFQTKNPNFGKFWRVLQWKILVYFYDILVYYLEIFYGHLVYFVVIWYIFSHFGILYEEKSSNPVLPMYVEWNKWPWILVILFTVDKSSIKNAIHKDGTIQCIFIQNGWIL
jgi:hypothetical protein